MKSSLLITLFILTGSTVFAQGSEDFGSALIDMKGGAKIVYSSKKHSFTLDIISNNIKPQPKPGYVTLDNKVLQFVFIGNKALQKSTNDDETQKAQLLGYMQYELDYIKNDLKINYVNLRQEWIVINDRPYLLWYYDMPADMAAKQNATQKQINLSCLCFAHVLNLNTPFLKDDKFDDDKGLLLKVSKTLKENNFSLDFNAVYKELHQQ